MPHYSLGSTRFVNPYALFAYAAYNDPYTYPTFDLYTDSFSRIDWTLPIDESFQSIMERRAIQLREKYDYLVFMFSGGTDSQTIYNVFKKLKIHIDEIVVAYHKDLLIGHDPAVVDWLRNDLYDPTTKITVKCRDELPEYLNTARSGFLLERDQFYWHMSCTLTGEIAYNLKNSDLFQQRKSAVIIGYEKPVVLFKDGRWWSTAIDKTYRTMMDGYEFFYISPDMPELHVKQSQLLKQFAKQFVAPTSYWSSAEFAAMSWQSYDTYSTWCGRDHNISVNNAIHQKSYEAARPLNIRSLIDPSWSSTDATRRLHSDNTLNFEVSSINKFFNEMAAIQSDRKILDYMSRMRLLPENGSIDQYYGIYSKFYDLGV